MIAVLRHALLLSVVAVASWWLFLYAPERGIEEVERLPLSIALTPLFESRVEEASFAVAEKESTPVVEPTEAPEPATEELPAPPPPELGDPDADPLADLEGSAEPTTPEEDAPVDEVVEASEDGRGSVNELMRDPHLLDAARSELTGETRRGFATVLLAAAKEQLDIARFFDEELVLVPKAALDPDAEKPTWFRIDHTGEPVVETMRSRPPLEHYRQHRDLFDYEYARLPAPVRELRRSLLVRNEIYIFAALVPVREWAVVVGRRDEALAESGRSIEEVRRFVLSYVRRAEGFDLVVDEIVFADGRRFLPEKSTKGG